MTDTTIMGEHQEIFNLLNQTDRLIDQIDTRIKNCLEESFCLEGISSEGATSYQDYGRLIKKAITHFTAAESESLNVQQLISERGQLCYLSLSCLHKLMAARRDFDVAPEISRSELLRRRLTAHADPQEIDSSCSISGCPMRAGFLNAEGESCCIAHYDNKKK